MEKRSPSHRFATFFCWFMAVFLVLFPKAGIKIGPYPITWGYAFIAITVVPLLIVRLLVLPLRFERSQIIAIAGLVPVQMICLYTAIFYGIENLGYAISTFFGLFALPWLFLLVYPPFFGFADGVKLVRYFRLCILIAALWGIFLFFWHPLTGHYIEIPYLTVNADDYGQIETTKHIDRGLFFKLISTYNNGNLYGVDTLIFLPLYELLEPVRWRRLAVKAALLLTLSRTVWVGIVFYELLPVFSLLMSNAKSFPRVWLGKIGKTLGAVAVVVMLVFVSLLFNGSTLRFLFDPELGGRAGGVTIFVNSATWMPMSALSGFQEVLYISAAQQWGYVGGAAFMVFMISPLWLLLFDRSALKSRVRTAALQGLIIYMLMATSDGVFPWIPTMVFYWFTYMIYIFGLPAAHRSRVIQKKEEIILGLPSQA